MKEENTEETLLTEEDDNVLFEEFVICGDESLRDINNFLSKSF